MNKQMQKELNEDIEISYKSIMQPLYRKWSKEYNSSELHEMFCFFVTRKHHQKIMNLYNHKKHRKLKIKILKTKIAALEFDNKETEFLESLNETTM